MSLNLRKVTGFKGLSWKSAKTPFQIIIRKVLASYLEGLEGKAYMETLSNSNLPNAHFVGPVVVRVVGGLDLAAVLLHLPTADGCM